MGPSFLHKQLADALNASEDPSRLQIIVAPTSGAALSLRTAAARLEVPLVNVEAVTPRGLALHVWRSMRPFDAGRLASRQRMVVVLASSLGALSGREADLLRPSLSRVAAGIESDRLAGRNHAWARERVRSATQLAYADLFRAYESHLDEYGLVDMADVQRVATELAEAFCSERDLEALLLCCETPILPSQTHLLETLGTEARSRVLLGDPALVDDLDGPWARNVFASWPLAEPLAPGLQGKPRVLQAATRRDEIWTVLADIVERATVFDDIELVVADRDTYAPMIDAACRRLGIPTTLQRSADSGLEAFRYALADYLTWIASGYLSRHLADLLRNPALTVPDGNGLSTLRLAELVERFQLTPAMLSRQDLLDILEEGARRDRVPPQEVRKLVQWMRDFRTHIPDSTTHPARFGMIIRNWVGQYVGAGTSQDMRARFVDNLLETFDGLQSERVESSWMASFLLESLHESTTHQDFGNGLHVVDWDEAGYGPRRRAYVLGLDDQASGGQPGEEATHVAGLEASHPNGYGRPIPARRRLRDLMKRYGDALTASVPAWDIRASRSLFPGSALVDAAGMDEVVASRRALRLDAADAGRQHPFHTETRFKAVNRGLRGQVQRSAEEWTAYDGMTGSRQGPVSLRLSPSRMEQYLACPYRYFLSSVLGLEGLPEEGEEWMDRAAEGSILHDLFEAHTRARVRGQSGITPEHEQQMLTSLKHSLLRQAARSGIDPDAFVDARFRELAHGVHRYFDRERRLDGEREPVHAEYAFSDSPRADARPASFRNEDGEILLTGRVDRIDEADSGDWIVVDYKTGKPEGFVPDKLLTMDEKLQWALYAWAVGKVSGRKVAASEYVFTSRTGAGWVSRVASPASEQVDPLFASVLKRIKSGHFIPAPDEHKTCTWCDFKAVCGDLTERKAAIQAKFNNADPEETRAFEGWAVREKNLPSS